MLYSVWHDICHICGCSVAKSCPTLCDPMDCSTPRLFVPPHLPKFAQVHAHCIGKAIQLSYPLMPSSLSALNLPQHQGVSRWSHLFASDDQNSAVSTSASLLLVNIQGWFSLRLTGLISLLSKGLSGVFSSTTVWRHQFFCVLYSLALTTIHDHWEDHKPWLYVPLLTE